MALARLIQKNDAFPREKTPSWERLSKMIWPTNTTVPQGGPIFARWGNGSRSLHEKLKMLLFKWFSGKSTASTIAADKDSGPIRRGSRGRLWSTRDQPASLPPSRVQADPGNLNGERKVKRHARREQLYLAVRAAFTHAGVLSATYRFKVLSLDQAGNQFLVMMDVDQSFDHRTEQLADIEARIVQVAKSRYDIHVTSVYWRVSTAPAPRSTRAVAQESVPATALQTHEAVSLASRKTQSFRYDPIQDDELAAFRQALVAASANSPVSTEAAGKARSGPRSYTLLTGFEDTEMPESASTPILSSTQYGDLN